MIEGELADIEAWLKANIRRPTHIQPNPIFEIKEDKNIEDDPGYEVGRFHPDVTVISNDIVGLPPRNMRDTMILISRGL